jgi:hypothetical protein
LSEIWETARGQYPDRKSQTKRNSCLPFDLEKIELIVEHNFAILCRFGAAETQ